MEKKLTKDDAKNIIRKYLAYRKGLDTFNFSEQEIKYTIECCNEEAEKSMSQDDVLKAWKESQFLFSLAEDLEIELIGLQQKKNCQVLN